MPKPKLSVVTTAVDNLVQMSYVQLFMVYGCGILACALGYWSLYNYFPGHGPTIPAGEPWETALNAIYFSLVTALSIGYGDIVPMGASKILAMAEAMGALFVFGILVSKPISYRQEVALSQVHMLTFNQAVKSVRETLFVLRRDLQTISEHAKEHGALTKRDWRNLVAAYRQYCITIESIQEFYSKGKSNIYEISAKRELMLIDAVQRTVERIGETLQALKAAGIAHQEHKEAHEELQWMRKINAASLPRWQRKSPHRNGAKLEKLLSTADKLSDLMKE